MRAYLQNRRSVITMFGMFIALVGLGALLLLPSASLRPDTSTGLGAGYIGYDTYQGGSTYLVPPSRVEPETDLTGSVSGSLVDETDSPIRSIGVELMPLDKTGDQRWYATQRDWTDANGRYRFPRVDPGEYILAVQKNGAPDGRHPFAGTYYPGVDDEERSDHIYVRTGAPIELHPLRLQRIATVALKINVTFEDGSRPAWSNLLFHNPSFPHQGVIGDEAPGIEDGKGEFVLPVGFEYYARAKVDCDAGDRIDTRESRPIKQLRIRNGQNPFEVNFVIPGPACRLWSPK